MTLLSGHCWGLRWVWLETVDQPTCPHRSFPGVLTFVLREDNEKDQSPIHVGDTSAALPSETAVLGLVPYSSIIPSLSLKGGNDLYINVLSALSLSTCSDLKLHSGYLCLLCKHNIAEGLKHVDMNFLRIHVSDQEMEPYMKFPLVPGRWICVIFEHSYLAQCSKPTREVSANSALNSWDSSLLSSLLPYVQRHLCLCGWISLWVFLPTHNEGHEDSSVGHRFLWKQAHHCWVTRPRKLMSSNAWKAGAGDPKSLGNVLCLSCSRAFPIPNLSIKVLPS